MNINNIKTKSNHSGEGSNTLSSNARQENSNKSTRRASGTNLNHSPVKEKKELNEFDCSAPKSPLDIILEALKTTNGGKEKKELDKYIEINEKDLAGVIKKYLSIADSLDILSAYGRFQAIQLADVSMNSSQRICSTGFSDFKDCEVYESDDTGQKLCTMLLLMNLEDKLEIKDNHGFFTNRADIKNNFKSALQGLGLIKTYIRLAVGVVNDYWAQCFGDEKGVNSDTIVKTVYAKFNTLNKLNNTNQNYKKKLLSNLSNNQSIKLIYADALEGLKDVFNNVNKALESTSILLSRVAPSLGNAYLLFEIVLSELRLFSESFFLEKRFSDENFAEAFNVIKSYIDLVLASTYSIVSNLLYPHAHEAATQLKIPNFDKNGSNSPFDEIKDMQKLYDLKLKILSEDFEKEEKKAQKQRARNKKRKQKQRSKRANNRQANNPPKQALNSNLSNVQKEKKPLNVSSYTNTAPALTTATSPNESITSSLEQEQKDIEIKNSINKNNIVPEKKLNKQKAKAIQERHLDTKAKEQELKQIKKLKSSKQKAKAIQERHLETKAKEQELKTKRRAETVNKGHKLASEEAFQGVYNDNRYTAKLDALFKLNNSNAIKKIGNVLSLGQKLDDELKLNGGLSKELNQRMHIWHKGKAKDVPEHWIDMLRLPFILFGVFPRNWTPITGKDMDAYEHYLKREMDNLVMLSKNRASS